MGTEQNLADTLIIFLAFLSCIEGKTDEVISLSLTACGEFTLGSVGYLLTGLHKNVTTVPNCDIVVTTARHDGRICIQPEEDKFFIHQANNIKFSAYDGIPKGQAKPIFEIKGDKIPWREYCTSGNKLTLGLKATPKYTTLELAKIKLRLKLYDISSRNRIFYTDGIFCDGDIQLRNSWVNVLRLIPWFNIEKSTTCDIDLTLSKDPSNRAKRICIVFLPVPEVNCRDINETLTFYSSEGTDNKRLTCDEVKKSEPYHVHCARASLNKYHILVVSRKISLNVNWFKLVVLDSEKKEDAIKKYVKRCEDTIEDGLEFHSAITEKDTDWTAHITLTDNCQIGNYRIFDDLISVHVNGADEKYCSINLADCDDSTGNCHCLVSGFIAQVFVIKAKMGPTEKNMTIKLSIPHHPPKEFLVGTISRIKSYKATKSDTDLRWMIVIPVGVVVLLLVLIIGMVCGYCLYRKIERKRKQQNRNEPNMGDPQPQTESIKPASQPQTESFKPASTNDNSQSVLGPFQIFSYIPFMGAFSGQSKSTKENATLQTLSVDHGPSVSYSHN